MVKVKDDKAREKGKVGRKLKETMSSMDERRRRSVLERGLRGRVGDVSLDGELV